jgi:hypothetical protein
MLGCVTGSRSCVGSGSASYLHPGIGSAGDFRAAGTSVAARQGGEQGNIAGRQRGHSHLTGEVVQNVLRGVVRLAGHVDSYARAI